MRFKIGHNPNSISNIPGPTTKVYSQTKISVNHAEWCKSDRFKYCLNKDLVQFYTDYRLETDQKAKAKAKGQKISI